MLHAHEVPTSTDSSMLGSLIMENFTDRRNDLFHVWIGNQNIVPKSNAEESDNRTAGVPRRVRFADNEKSA